jgi:WhiB family redox-sensing transcriptional regulator
MTAVDSCHTPTARLADDFGQVPATRLFETTEPRPCAITKPGPGNDLWFSTDRSRERAARLCQRCPFIGRCGYNAVASRATHGVWGGMVFPGDKAAALEKIYEKLLDQFEQRRPIELGHAPAPKLPAADARRRRRSATATAAA